LVVWCGNSHLLDYVGYEKFLDISGVQRNGTSSSHIHGRPYHKFNEKISP